MDIGEMIKTAFAGPNAYVFVMLSVIAFFAHRMAFLSTRSAFAAVATIAGVLGGFQGLIQAQAIEGVAPAVLGNSVLVGGITGAGSVLLLGWGVSTALDKAGVWSVSQEKLTSEAVRDPMSAVTPPGTPIKTEIVDGTLKEK